MYRLRPSSARRRAPALLAAAFTVLVLFGVAPVAGAADAPLEVRAGDHIAIIGNTLADRMQHDGWLEAYLYSRFPDRDLVVRNLGFSADEVELSRRLRSLDFGTPDHWLSFTR